MRIIAGEWRGSVLRFPALDGARPTGDRIRETVFNWLAPMIPGARCLDAFAGSGALGLEAASRGAARVTLVEREGALASYLRETVERLGADCVEVIHADVIAWLDRVRDREPLDVVFLDPPFSSDLLAPILDRLARPGVLAPGARVYVETAADAPGLPAGFEILRTRTAGQVRYHLASFDAGSGRE